MNIDLIIAMIQRREFAASDSARKLERDPMLRNAHWQQRAVASAMKALLKDINEAIATEDRDS